MQDPRQGACDRPIEVGEPRAPDPSAALLAKPSADVLYRAADARDRTPLDLLSTRFALQAIIALGPKFNLRRDINNLVTLAGRHLVWPSRS